MTDQTNKATRGFIINMTIAGKTTSQVVEGSSLSVGRLDECDLPLRLETLSRKHATITLEDGVFSLIDHGSANGSFINGMRVQAGIPSAFTPNDIVVMGQDAVKFTVSLRSEASTAALQVEQKLPENTSPLTASSTPKSSDVIPKQPFDELEKSLSKSAINSAQAAMAAENNAPKTADNIILEAQKKAAALIHKAEVEAAQKNQKYL